MVSRRSPRLKESFIEWEEWLPFGERSPAATGASPRSIRTAGGRVERMLSYPNPRCRGGGFELTFLVESMANERVAERTGVLVCVGWERNTGSSREESPCTTAIRYRIRLSYAGAVGQATRRWAGENGKGQA